MSGAITDLSALARGPKAVAKVMRPKSVAIIGMSARPGSAGQNILNGLKANNFQGEIYLVGRNPEPIDGRKLLASPLDLPEGVDLAVFTLPAAGVKDAVSECVQRKVGAALVFAAGFAETGQHDVQAEVTKTAREGGLAIVGPNCLGYSNNVDGFALHMLFANAAKKWQPGAKPGVAFVGQSGGMIGHMQRAAEARRMAISYVMTTGNEAGLDLADFTEYLVEDPHTGVLVLYSEDIRRPKEFMAACELARAAKKPVVLLHPGRSAKARAATASHTGSLVGDHGAMLANVANAGVLVVDTLDELVDVAELLTRYPEPPVKGPAVLTASGAFVALINDFTENSTLEFPALTPETMEKLRAALPAFGTPNNPLDTTAGSAPGSNIPMTKALLADPNIGSLFISYPIAGPKGVTTIGEFTKGMEGNTKPVVVVALGDNSPLAPELQAAADAGPFVFHRSSDRCLRSLEHFHRYGRLLARPRGNSNPAPFSGLPAMGKGPQPEWLGKKVFAAAGIRVPEGGLAKSVDEAVATAKRIGYPVVMKGIADHLPHKSDLGLVRLGLADAAAVTAAFAALDAILKANARGGSPGEIVVEKTATEGIELIVGIRNQKGFGSFVVVGPGGVLVEVTGKAAVRMGPVDEETALAMLDETVAGKLLRGVRGKGPWDIGAAAKAIAAFSRFGAAHIDSLAELEINPLIVGAKGRGAVGVDVLLEPYKEQEKEQT